MGIRLDRLGLKPAPDRGEGIVAVICFVSVLAKLDLVAYTGHLMTFSRACLRWLWI
jgi:hypothetical protein